MKSIDVRLDEKSVEILKSLIGKKMISYEHVPFKFTNSVPQFVRFRAEGDCNDRDDYNNHSDSGNSDHCDDNSASDRLVEKKAFLYCFTEKLDYFGSHEDVSVLSVDDKEYPFFEDESCISFPVNEVIEKVFIVQENQRLVKKELVKEDLGEGQLEENCGYDVWLTRGIIFEFGVGQNSYQLSFEKGSWLSEQIVIRKGYDLINEFKPTDQIISDFGSEDPILQCSRTVVEL